ncbi:dTMP kinase [Kribbella sp. NPDC059898]|uniref:dTMP kinase n=1 Tax=Kribbella sp. NPDC059898 TaxID=3346995 RepID=UPI00365D5939
MTRDRRWPGFFVTLDGPGGVGKSTAIAGLTAELAEYCIPVQQTAEPSRGAIGQLARHGTHEFSGRALACLVAADRYHHLDTELRPALNAGRLVLCDRYVATSLVLQRRDGVPVDFIDAINSAADAPDLAVILTATAATIRARLRARGVSSGRFEDNGGTDIDLGYYADAADRLAGRGVDVLTVDVDAHRPCDTVRAISTAIRARWASLAEPTPQLAPTDYQQGATA